MVHTTLSFMLPYGFPPQQSKEEIRMANYENKKSYNNIAPKSGEHLVPVLAYDLVKWDDECVRNGLAAPGQLVNKSHLETWHLDGVKILVGFVAVPDAQAETSIRAFWEDVNDYIETAHKKCSIDTLIDNDKTDDTKSYALAATTENEEIALFMITVNMLIDELASQNENYGKIIRLLAEGYEKDEILDILKLDKGSPKSYAYISKVQKIAKELYDEKYR